MKIHFEGQMGNYKTHFNISPLILKKLRKSLSLQSVGSSDFQLMGLDSII